MHMSVHHSTAQCICQYITALHTAHVSTSQFCTLHRSVHHSTAHCRCQYITTQHTANVITSQHSKLHMSVHQGTAHCKSQYIRALHSTDVSISYFKLHIYNCSKKWPHQIRSFYTFAVISPQVLKFHCKISPICSLGCSNYSNLKKICLHYWK